MNPTLMRVAYSAALLVILTACSALPDKPVRAVTYDFGPGAVTSAVAVNSVVPQALAPIALAEIESGSALNGTAVLYRLMYANAQELRPYAQARWSMPPAQLLRQRLREHLGKSRGVVNPGEAVASTISPWVVRLELEEFSQLFESTSASVGLLRMRATVIQAHRIMYRHILLLGFVIKCSHFRECRRRCNDSEQSTANTAD